MTLSGKDQAEISRATARIDTKAIKENHRTLAGRVQDSYFGCMQKMTLILESVSRYVTSLFSKKRIIFMWRSGVKQGKQLLDMTAKVMYD